MGFRGQFARQQSETAHVCFGSEADIEAFHTMSALPPKADIVERDCHVRFVPIGGIRSHIRSRLMFGYSSCQNKGMLQIVWASAEPCEHADDICCEAAGGTNFAAHGGDTLADG